MAMVVLGLALYLMALARWGKSLKERNATLKRRRIYGFVGAAPPLLAPFVFGIGTLGSWENLFLCTWYAACAVLDYATVVYAPQWIVGKPKPPKMPKIRIR
ncbi:MAG: hypothetical protein WBD73_09625 [Candidatus Acidiferrales bacterium]